jgi:circadian clock protein KaiC
MVAEIVRKTLEDEPAVVVIDSAKMLRDYAGERELRGALHDLTASFAETGAVLLLVGEYTPEDLGGSTEFSLADGIIQLEYQVREPVDRRSLRVVKMRGGRHVPGRHTFHIGPGGIRVFPGIETLMPASSVASVSGPLRSGIPGLDKLMPNGMRLGDATLIMGPSGVGTTTLGMRWITQGLEEGERCLFVTFQDTAGHLINMGAAFGWDLAAARASGRLVISYVSMGDLDLDVLANAVRDNLPGHPVSRSASTAWLNWSSPTVNGTVSPPTCAAWSGSSARQASPSRPPARRPATGSPPSRWKGSCSCSTTSSTCGTSSSTPRRAARSTSSRCGTARTR